MFLTWLYTGELLEQSCTKKRFVSAGNYVEAADEDAVGFIDANAAQVSPETSAVDEMAEKALIDERAGDATSSLEVAEDEIYHEGDDDYDWRQHRLIDLYVFADRREVPSLKNLIADHFILQREDDDIEWGTSVWSGWYFKHVRSAFSQLPKGDGLLRFFIDETVWYWSSYNEPSSFENHGHSLPADYLVGALSGGMRLARLKEKPASPWFADMRHYHDTARKTKDRHAAGRMRALRKG